jgi:hypothetical protein
VTFPADRDVDPTIVTCLLAGLEGGHVAFCLCDTDDQVRYVNPAFRAAFFANAPETPFEFTEALGQCHQSRPWHQA